MYLLTSPRFLGIYVVAGNSLDSLDGSIECLNGRYVLDGGYH